MILVVLSSTPVSSSKLQDRNTHNNVSRSSFAGKNVFIGNAESKRIEFLEINLGASRAGVC